MAVGLSMTVGCCSTGWCFNDELNINNNDDDDDNNDKESLKCWESGSISSALSHTNFETIHWGSVVQLVLKVKFVVLNI